MKTRALLAAACLLACQNRDAAPAATPTVTPSTTPTVSASATATPTASAEPSPAPLASTDLGPPPLKPECTGALLDRHALGACRAQGIGRPATGFRFSLSATALTIRSGEAADLELTVENVTSSTIRGSLEVPSELVGVMTMRVGTPHIDMECISGSGPVRTEPRPPPPPTLIEIELPAGGKLQWTQRVWATQVVNIIDRAKLAGFTGSGTPCIGREDPTPKGAYVLKVPSVFRWMPPYEVAVTVR